MPDVSPLNQGAAVPITVRCSACKKLIQFKAIAAPTVKRCPLCREPITIRPREPAKPADPPLFGEAPVKVTFEETNEPPDWLPNDGPPLPNNPDPQGWLPTSSDPPSNIPPSIRALRLPPPKPASEEDLENGVSKLLMYAALAWTGVAFFCALYLVDRTIIFMQDDSPLARYESGIRFSALFALWGMLAGIWLVPTVGLSLLSIAFKKK